MSLAEDANELRFSSIWLEGDQACMGNPIMSSPTKSEVNFINFVSENARKHQKYDGGWMNNWNYEWPNGHKRPLICPLPTPLMEELCFILCRNRSRYGPSQWEVSYIVTTSLIGWAHTKTDPWSCHIGYYYNMALLYKMATLSQLMMIHTFTIFLLMCLFPWWMF